ncbi:MAG: ABC transporter permease subunit, partial [Candidatus Kapaibacterium sp.]
MILLRSVWNECIKIILKPRTYLGFGALTLLISVILFALKADGAAFIGFATASFEQTLSFQGTVLNGNLVGFIILQMLIIHVPLLVALVTGDVVSGEAAAGTLRMIATKPISRVQLLLSKFIAGGIYTLVMVTWFAFLAIVMARWLFGDGD